jgi:predicted AlkP superfamily phosphohydrolase/phosphomutase
MRICLSGALTGVIIGCVYAVFVGVALAYRSALPLHPPDVLVLVMYLAAFYGGVGSLVLGFAGLVISIFARSSAHSCRRLFPFFAAFGIAILLLSLLSVPGYLPGRLQSLHRMSVAGKIGSILLLSVGAMFVCSLLGRVRYRKLVPSGKKSLVFIVLAILMGGIILAGNSEKDVEWTGMSADNAGSRLFLLGIDGVTFSIMQPMIESGRLPHFRRLMEGGCSGLLETIYPTLSPVIWTSIATGKDYHDHGITSFLAVPVWGMERPLANFAFAVGFDRLVQRLGSTSVPMTSAMRAEKAFWNIYSEAGLSVGVVGWYGSWPCEDVNGYIVSDRALKWMSGSPESSSIVCPESLFESVSSRLLPPESIEVQELAPLVNLSEEELEAVIAGDYREFPYLAESALKKLRICYNTDRWKYEVGRFLLASYPTRVFAIYFSGLDAVEHLFWGWMEPEYFPDIVVEDIERYGETIEKYYEYMDQLLGSFLASMHDDDRFLVFSDHGHHRNRSRSGPRQPYGAHMDAPAGIFLIYGEGIKEGRRISGATVYDILPTILYLCGFPVAKDLKGRVLEEVFADEYRGKHPILYIPSYGKRSTPFRIVRSASDGEVKDWLKALGYIE